MRSFKSSALRRAPTAALLMLTSGLMAGCAAQGRAIVSECPAPEFLTPVTETPVVKGEDVRIALARRTGELVTANRRIVAARDYLKTSCAKASK